MKIDNLEIIYKYKELELARLNVESKFINEIVNWLNDKNHMKFSNQRFNFHTVDTQLEYISNSQKSGNQYLAGIINEQLIGTSSVIFHNPHKVAEIGILISNKETYKGIGSTLFNAVEDYVIKNFAIAKIRGGCVNENIGMKKIFEKNDYILEATLKKEEIIDNRRTDLLVFSKYFDI